MRHATPRPAAPAQRPRPAPGGRRARRLPLAVLALGGLLGGGHALAQAEAERRLDAALERLRAAFGPAATLQVASRQVDPVTGRARLSGLLIREGDQEVSAEEAVVEDVSEARLGRVELRGLRQREGADRSAEAARLLLAGVALPPPGAPFDPATLALGALELEALRLRQDGGAVQLARLAVADYAPGRLGAARAEGLAFDDGAGTAFRLGRVEAEALVLPAPGTELDPAALRAGRLALEGAALAEAGSGVTLRLGRATVTDWLPGRLAEALAEGLEAEGDLGFGPGALRLGRVVLSGVDGPAALAASLAGAAAPDPAPGVPQLLALEGLELDSAGAPLLALGRVAVEARLDAARFASGALTVEGFRLVPPAGAATAWLREAGYREVTGSAELRGQGPRDGGELAVAPLRLSWEQAATLTLTAQFLDMPATQPGQVQDPQAALAAYAAARLEALTLRWRDHGLLGRVLAAQARAQRVPEARLREQWAQLALALPVPGEAPPPRPGQPRAAPGLRGPDPFLSLRQSLAAFIRQPGEIEIALRPAQPVPLGELAAGGGDPAATARRLGFVARIPSP